MKFIKNQYRYIINLNERGQFSASIYRIKANGEDTKKAVIEIDTEEAYFLSDEGINAGNGERVIRYYADLQGFPVSYVLTASEEPKQE